MALSDSSSAMNRGRNFLNKFTDDGEPIRFAFYNTLFFLLMFNIFFMPILWATLIGTVIFPIKRTISFYLNGWLLRLDESNTPMMLGICLIPMNALTGISRLLYENLISAHGIYYILAYVALKVLSYNGTLVHLLGFAGKVYSFCDLLLAFITQNWKEDTVKANSNRLESTVQELNTDKDVVNTLITSSTRSSLGNNYIRAMFLLCLLLWTAKHDSVLIVVISLILFAAGLSFIDRLDVPRKLYTTYRESATNEYVNRIANVTVPGALRQFFYILFTSDKYAYQQSRIWLASNIRSLADPKDTKRADQLERQAKMLVDNLYHLWEERSVLMSSNASQTTAVSRGDWLGQLMSASNLETLKSEIVLVVKENIETVISVLSSLWRVVSLNLGLFYSVAWTILGFIFGFGFDLLNFFIEIIVFLTVVYYLLASSNEQWLPLRWISDIEPSIQPTNSKVSISSAIESAISSVFVLSAKMSIFYGLYTVLVQNRFLVFAAGLASVPVVPPYAVAIFGAIELYAVRAETAATVVFCLVSIAPLFFADLTFYSEVKNSHPYITGLAVLGGVNCFGIQGAIIGPIVLCTLIVVINVYAEFAKKR
ncbi:hypothetical protein M3Y98_00274800 [Aphelenchoides besseyi]|nr:hypothetical protein M3Y98_00274800 [Aphelenchoides besseyi]